MEAEWTSTQFHCPTYRSGMRLFVVLILSYISQILTKSAPPVTYLSANVHFSIGVCHQSQNPRGHRYASRETEVAV